MIVLASGETLGARVRRLRRARGWSQWALAIQMNTDQANVSDWERDRTHPQPATLHRIAAALGCDVVDLLS